ncbi:hypothetical protein [Oceaniglobus trochenteri]|uniref:hypothetical protein n=1 Tax=Oceaniglobus trochenteri TaxID=2763260 RepID=UPI001CFFD5D7|nr:hypothetical protein [Oceaniglobus trochenteri]
MPETTARHLGAANRDNGELVLQVARVLVPVGATGKTKAAIKGRREGEHGYLMDFGPLSSILEGGTKERVNKAGKSSGKGPKRPFVNPALKATDRKRRARANKALRDAIKEAGGNG